MLRFLFAANRETNERASKQARRNENYTRTTRSLVALWRPEPDVERAVLGAASHAYRLTAPLIGERPLPRMQGDDGAHPRLSATVRRFFLDAIWYQLQR